VCGRSCGPGSVLFGCRACRYDVCESCILHDKPEDVLLSGKTSSTEQSAYSVRDGEAQAQDSERISDSSTTKAKPRALSSESLERMQTTLRDQIRRRREAAASWVPSWLKAWLARGQAEAATESIEEHTDHVHEQTKLLAIESLRFDMANAPLKPVLMAALSHPRTALLACEHLVSPGFSAHAAEYWTMSLAVSQRDRWADPKNFWTQHKVLDLAEHALHLPATYDLMVPLLIKTINNEKITQRPLTKILEKAIPQLQPMIEVQLVDALSRVAENDRVRATAKEAVIGLINCQHQGKPPSTQGIDIDAPELRDSPQNLPEKDNRKTSGGRRPTGS